jgi:hypothetical protein
MRERGRQFLTYTSHVTEGEDKDRQCGHIIGPSWVLHLPASYSYKTEFITMHIISTLQFCDWGRQMKLNFLFPSDTVIGLQKPYTKTEVGTSLELYDVY